MTKTKSLLRLRKLSQKWWQLSTETSTGRLQRIDRLGAAVREVGGFLVVDAVASLTGAPVKADEWQNRCSSWGAHKKCLGALPGMSLVTFNRPVCGRNQQA
ncbi:aminotransferase class V-fold PLP-dependent enzyme [Limosilactobacillus fermentum]